jgi:hypothetical protein
MCWIFFIHGEQYFNTQRNPKLLGVTCPATMLLFSPFDCGDWWVQKNPLRRCFQDPEICATEALVLGLMLCIQLTRTLALLCAQSFSRRIILPWSSLTLGPGKAPPHF